MTDWDLRQRLDRLADDVRDTLAAIHQSRVGNQINLCPYCGAPTVTGGACPKCSRDHPCANPS